MLTISPDLVPQLEAEFRRGWQMRRVNAEIQSKQAAKYTKMRHRSIDGLGQKIGPGCLSLLGTEARIPVLGRQEVHSRVLSRQPSVQS